MSEGWIITGFIVLPWVLWFVEIVRHEGTRERYRNFRMDTLQRAVDRQCRTPVGATSDTERAGTALTSPGVSAGLAAGVTVDG